MTALLQTAILQLVQLLTYADNDTHTQRTNCCTRTAKVLECGGKDFSSVDVLDKNYQLFISKL